MTNEELNKRIHEILGMCWHSGHWVQGWRMTCDTCGDQDFKNIDFTTSWPGFGILWEWWQKQEKFTDFLREASADRLGFIYWKVVSSPLALAEATVEFFKEK